MKTTLVLMLAMTAAGSHASELSTAPVAAPAAPIRPAPVALALDLALGATIWQRVEVSTSGPIVDITRLVRQGFYKLEIIQLILMSAEAGKPLKKAVERRREGAKLSEIAAEYKIEYEPLYERALAVQEIIDKEYLPRLYRKRARKRYIE